MKELTEPIINWYSKYKRDLPWRKTNNPYLIWLSEIILQQTRVDQGMDYFLKFRSQFPTVTDLANAHEDEVLKLWQGLGYYSRARNLHAAAKYISHDLNGTFPNTYKEILLLKGVGPYTAAAIASFEMPICYIKCSRYDTCNMDPISLTKVTMDVALNRHDEQYKVSRAPDKAEVENKRVLMIDDASVSGGTFRATSKHLISQLGASKCRGLALCDFNGLTHIFDPNRDDAKLGPVTVQKLDVGTFTPWGTF